MHELRAMTERALESGEPGFVAPPPRAMPEAAAATAREVPSLGTRAWRARAARQAARASTREGESVGERRER